MQLLRFFVDAGSQWDLNKNGHMFPGGAILDLTPKEFTEAEKNGLIEVYVDKETKKVEKITKTELTYTKAFLEEQTFTQLKEIGKKFNVTDRSKDKLIIEILEAQK